uniref:Uncharacterized protein n=1 Tax=Lotus japonicus TaxID=34305 RepID=I3S472_LOTJA|nr:unknown [Lotus japonicus]
MWWRRWFFRSLAPGSDKVINLCFVPALVQFPFLL